MTFKSKILLNEIKNEFGRWKTKRRYCRFKDLSMIFRVSKNGFLLQSTTPYTISLKIMSFKVIMMKKFKKMFIREAFSS